MKKFTLASLALLSLAACGPTTPATPPQVSLEVATNSKVQNVVTVNVTVTGEGLHEVTLTRQGVSADPQSPQTLKKVTAAPFSFTFDDTLPGNGTYRYTVVAFGAGYRTEAQRQVTYTYTVGKP